MDRGKYDQYTERLSELIGEYAEKRDSFDSKELLNMRESLALALFYLSDFVSEISFNHMQAEYNRRRAYALKREELKADKELNSPRKLSQKVLEDLARIDCEGYDLASSEARREKDRVTNTVESTRQILNAISTRIGMLKH